LKDSILIDTNLLLDDPEILFKLQFNYKTIVIPITVLKELDKHKFDPDLSYSARQAINAIRTFKNDHPEKLKLDVNENDISTNDLRIIRAATETNSEIATKDISMSLIAECKDVSVKLYGNIANGIYDPYIYVQTTTLDSNFIYLPCYYNDSYEVLFELFTKDNKTVDKESWFFVFLVNNDFIAAVYAHNPLKHSFDCITGVEEYTRINNKDINVVAKDLYQKCAIYALYNAEHVLITGPWGSGKSLLATAYAIVHNDKKTFISRPPLGVDRRYDIGFLPGDKHSKLEGWAMGFLSAVYYLFGNTQAQTKDSSTFDYVKDEIFYTLFELIDINSLQGLSLLDDFLLIDECQYTTIDLMSMILSRASRSSKIILMGDLRQSYSMKPSNSGLLKLLRVMPHKSMAYVDLKNSYRSDLLELADKLQDKSF